MSRVLRVPEIRLLRARREDQAVVAELAALPEGGHAEPARTEIDAVDLAEENGGVALAAQDVADRRRDVPLGKQPGRRLVEQRREQVVVGAVDDGDVDVRVAQTLRRGESAVARADDYDAVATRMTVRVFHSPGVSARAE